MSQALYTILKQKKGLTEAQVRDSAEMKSIMDYAKKALEGNPKD